MKVIDLELHSRDFELAAEFSNTARSKGIQGSNTDFLICSVAHRHNLSIFTIDKDFILYSKILPISLYESRLKPNLL
jgi:hypothetical protein